MSTEFPLTQDFSGDQAGLVGYWKFDGNLDNDGEAGAIAARGCVDSYLPGLFPGSESLHFNGLAALELIEQQAGALHGDTELGFSLEAMLQPLARSQRAAIVCRRGVEESGVGFEWVLEDTQLVFRILGRKASIEVAAKIAKDWHYVVATLRRQDLKSGGFDYKARLWLDGEVVATEQRVFPEPLDYRVEFAHHSIGGRQGRDFLYADIDFLRQWNRPLRKPEIAEYARPGVAAKAAKRENLGAY